MLEAADSRASTIRTHASTITEYQTRFQMEVCPFKELKEVEEEICLKMMLWRSLSEWEDLTHRWYQSEVSELDVRKVRHVTGEYRGRVNHLMGASEEDQHSDVLFHLDSLVSLLEEKLPVMEALTDSALRPRHWQEIDASLSSSLPRALTLAHVDQLALHQHTHTLQQVTHTAQLQREMENRLKQIEERWEEATIPIKDYIRKDMYVLEDLSHLDTLLLETDLTLHLLLHSQHGLHIKTDTITWKNTHTIIKHTLDRIVALVSPQQETLTLAKSGGLVRASGELYESQPTSPYTCRHLNTPLNLYSSILPYQVEETLDSVSSTFSRPDLSIVASDIRRELQEVTETLRNGSNSDNMQNEQRQDAESVQDYRENEQQYDLQKDSPSSKFYYEWIQHLRHRVVGSGRTAGVEVAAGMENVDYGYEYVGVTAPPTLTPATLRTRHALLTAAATHRCGVAVGAVGEGKTETLRGLSRAAGQHLASLTCSARTPAQSLYSVISGGVQGGFWLLFEEAALLPPALLQCLAQCLHNIRYTKLNALRRCRIDGQEMKLVDSFSLFLTVTSPPDPIVAPHCPLLASPLPSPHHHHRLTS
ncbi:hypothetical protein Pmani_016019 [Petrolisthes manimaculis]|uniref:Dynein heavy chain n=1 Tax=Petrolisthes manimaculis TaxID=1843537 RepID=A0AAE1PSM5_9EUCA|nr:hypothetical protein Pmani_016019 [Petrolisthes manimaculis]